MILRRGEERKKVTSLFHMELLFGLHMEQRMSRECEHHVEITHMEQVRFACYLLLLPRFAFAACSIVLATAHCCCSLLAVVLNFCCCCLLRLEEDRWRGSRWSGRRCLDLRWAGDGAAELINEDDVRAKREAEI